MDCSVNKDSDLSSPFEYSLPPDINQSDEQDNHEDHHLPVEYIPHGAIRLVLQHAGKDHGPGHEEDRFDVEQQKDHGYEVEFDRLALACGPDRLDAAFIRHELGPVWPVPARDAREDDHGRCEAGGEYEDEKNGNVVDYSLIYCFGLLHLCRSPSISGSRSWIRNALPTKTLHLRARLN